MKRLIPFVLAFTALLAAGTAWAALDYAADWWTVDGGAAGWASAGSYRLGASVGQPEAETVAGGWYELHGGYWPGARVRRSEIYLPVIIGRIALAPRFTYGQIMLATCLLALSFVIQKFGLPWRKRKWAS